MFMCRQLGEAGSEERVLICGIISNFPISKSAAFKDLTGSAIDECP